MNGMILTGRFSEFVTDFVKATNEEKEQQHNWEFFLHRVWDKTFETFKKEIEEQKQVQNMSERTIETTIQHSMNILNNFNPDREG